MFPIFACESRGGIFAFINNSMEFLTKIKSLPRRQYFKVSPLPSLLFFYCKGNNKNPDNQMF